MAFAKKSVDKKDLKQGGSNYISGSGFYPVNIIAPFVTTNDKGSDVVDFFVDHLDQLQVVYGNVRVTNNQKDENGYNVANEIGMKIFNQLLVIGDIEEVSDPVESNLPIGKDAKEKTVAVLEDMADMEVIMRVQMEYGFYNNKITEKKVIKAFYRASDNATAEEIVNDEKFGETFEKEQKYAETVTYKDNMTAEGIQEWIDGGRKETGSSASAGSASATNTKKPTFGVKRKFGAK